jgi:hypothetical protein
MPCGQARNGLRTIHAPSQESLTDGECPERSSTSSARCVSWLLSVFINVRPSSNPHSRPYGCLLQASPSWAPLQDSQPLLLCPHQHSPLSPSSQPSCRQRHVLLSRLLSKWSSSCRFSHRHLSRWVDLVGGGGGGSQPASKACLRWHNLSAAFADSVKEVCVDNCGNTAP